MQSKSIKVRLNSESIGQAISSLKEYQSSVKIKQAKLMKEIGERGTDVMFDEIGKYPMPCSKANLIRCVDYTSTGTTSRIYNWCGYAMFVEFGTGIKGARSPHPHDTVGYRYDVNNHGEDGWNYFDEDGWHWTMGMQARPFAHETYEVLRPEIINIAAKVFNND